MIRFCLVLLAVLCISWTDLGFTTDVQGNAFVNKSPEPLRISKVEREMWVNEQLKTLTLDEKIGQLLLIDYDMSGQKGISSQWQAVRELHIGGFIVRRSMGLDKIADNINNLQNASNTPLFIAADFERGVGSYDDYLTELPSNMALGASRDIDLAAQAGMVTAVESRSIGVNLIFAPVVDVNNNPDNPIINTRSYGEDPALVAEMAEAFVQSAETYGVLTTLKHFPGHGNTSIDSHSNLGMVSGDKNSLERTELLPYRRIIQSPTPPSMVMTAHLTVPAIDNRNIPATFSDKVLQGLLRNDMGFEGVIITDGINMGAITKNYSFDESIIRPIEAGADIVLLPTNPRRAFDVLKEAVLTGRISQTRLEESVRRILNAKAKIGLHRSQQRRDGRRVSNFSALEMGTRGVDIADAIAEHSVTLLKNDNLLPISQGKSITLVQLTYSNSGAIRAAMNEFSNTLKMETSVKDYQIRGRSSFNTNQILNSIESSDVVVLTTYLRTSQGRGNVSLNTDQAYLARKILDTGKPVIFVALGNPYIVEQFLVSDAIVTAYDQSMHSAKAVANHILGLQNATGQLPISVGYFEYGTGIGATNDQWLKPSWNSIPEAKQDRRRDF